MNGKEMAVRVVFLVAAHAAFIAVQGQSSGDCAPSATTGCLNGVSYEFATQFPCGNQVYNWSTTGCCAQALPFNTSQSFCCYDGVHDFDQYYCGAWKPVAAAASAAASSAASIGSSIDGETAWERVLRPGQRMEDVLPIDTKTRLPPPPEACLHGTTAFGCLNGHRYNWKTEYCCNSFIVLYNTTGCCDGVCSLFSSSLPFSSLAIFSFAILV